MEKTSVVLADWQVLFREGIHFTLSGEDDIEVIAEATNNEEALSFIETNPPSVVILNANHNKPTGIDVTRRIKQSFPSISVILVMDEEDEEKLFLAMKSGASACLTKDIDPDELVNIIREVTQGERPISELLLKPGLVSRVLSQFEAFSVISEQVDNLLARLSSRETQILRYIADGGSSESVAQALGISEEAIKEQLDVILTKLVANDHNLEVIEAAQSRLPLITSKMRLAGKPGLEYITKDEFTAFKQSITERLKSFIGELG